MSNSQLADEVWRDLSRFVLEHKDSWKKAVVDRTGLPFSRIRILRRLAQEPLTVKQVAQAGTVGAPAATVAVNDLEERGLVVREVDPANRRSKVVSLTEAGRQMVAVIDATDDPAPGPLRALSADDLDALRAVMARLKG